MAYQQNQVYGQQATPQTQQQQQDVVSGDQYRYALTNFVSTDHLLLTRLKLMSIIT